jgi:hypothetical protein
VPCPSSCRQGRLRVFREGREPRADEVSPGVLAESSVQGWSMYLVDVYGRPPEMVLLLVKVPHADLAEVTGVVFLLLLAFVSDRWLRSTYVHVGPVAREGQLRSTTPYSAATYWCWPPARPRPPGCFRCLPGHSLAFGLSDCRKRSRFRTNTAMTVGNVSPAVAKLAMPIYNIFSCFDPTVESIATEVGGLADYTYSFRVLENRVGMATVVRKLSLCSNQLVLGDDFTMSGGPVVEYFSSCADRLFSGKRWWGFGALRKLPVRQ